MKSDIIVKPNIKSLGLDWNKITDNIIFHFNDIVTEASTVAAIRCTILKISAKIYDPLSILAPITLQLKMLF